MKNICLLVVAATLAMVTVSFAKPETVDHGAAAHKSSHFKDGVHNPVFDHEALFGSRNTEELDDLPSDVKKRRLYTLAKSHDANNDDIIDAEELKAWVLQSFKMLDQEEANERFPEDDGNSDGQVTLTEIVHKAYGYSEEDVVNMEIKMADSSSDTDSEDDESKEILRLIRDDRKRFEAADLNKDKSLDKIEYVAYLQPYDYEYMSEVEMERALNDLDTDKDGFVSSEEFIGDVGDDEAQLSEETNFKELDKNGDGKLDREELRPWAMPDNADVADEEVEHLMQECDEDKDGKLSVDEIVSKEEEFLSSSATDYGRHLHFVRDEL